MRRETIGGGLWNPELMNHKEVQRILIDARDVIEITARERATAQREPIADVENALIAAIRDADGGFESLGGSGTKHYVREFLVPALQKYGLKVTIG
jgi:hypothetical protein